jgi:hypothetical protein
MTNIKVERVGGLGGFGGPHLKSDGELPAGKLTPSESAAVDALFNSGAESSRAGKPDGFRYRITRQTPNGPQTVEVPEDAVPEKLKNCVQDRLD